MPSLPLRVTEVERSPRGIRFPVDQVALARHPLPVIGAQESAAGLIGETLEACSSYRQNAIAKVDAHPLLEAVHRAYADHRPLSLSPDHLWQTILQGFAAHVRGNAEALRDRLVRHQGTKALSVRASGIVPGSPESDWAGVVERLAEAVAADTRSGLPEELLSEFSTTGPAEGIAARVALLDAYSPYYDYVVVLACGIPWVELQGSAEDWRILERKVEALAPFDLEWWLEHLRPVLSKIRSAAEGEVDPAFWRRIYKIHEGFYGAQSVNGWLLTFFPYLREGDTNDLLGHWARECWSTETAPAGYSRGAFPLGLSRVSFLVIDPVLSRSWDMELYGGFIGVTQDPETLALSPLLGWAVRPETSVRAVAEELERRFECRDPSPHGVPYELGSVGVSKEFVQLFEVFDGAKLRDDEGLAYAWIASAGQIAAEASDRWFCWCRFFDGRRLWCRSTNRAVVSSFGLPTDPEAHVVAESLHDALRILLEGPECEFPNLRAPKPGWGTL